MIELFIVCLAVLSVLLAAEFGRRKHLFSNELGRKSVHITVGTFVAFWPLFLSWMEIMLLSMAFILVVVVSKYANLFKAIHTVQRPTLGEVYFAFTVGLLAYVTQDGWIYMAALLHMALADGLAAVVGVEFGKRTSYKVLGHTKSVLGSAVFFAISLAIIWGYTIVHDVTLIPLVFVGIAGVATLLENISFKGLDNLTVPLWIAFVLTQIS